MIKQCLLVFGGAVSEGASQFSFQAGTAPSRATIRTRLGVSYPQIGTLVVTDGLTSRSFPNCRVIRHTIRSTGRGRMREITIEDRRWRWQAGRVWGEYNQPEQGGIDPATKRSARELASLLFEAMGERQYDVSVLPDNVYPATSWDADLAAPALDSLCQTYGCLVALQLNGFARVYRNNQGRRPAIDSRAMDATPSSEPEVVPPLMIFEGGHILWQYDLPLEPVGIETEKNRGIIVPIDQLSYKPADGWGKVAAPAFTSVQKEYRDLARRSVWRMFRVKPPFQLSPPPSDMKVTDDQASKTLDFFNVKADELWRILPLRTEQVATAGSTKTSEVRQMLLMGAFIGAKSVRTNNVDVDDYPALKDPAQQLPTETDNPFTDILVHQEGFSLDAATGIVTTNRPLYYLLNEECTNPYLRLRTSFNLRHRTLRQYVSAQYQFRPQSPTPGAVDPELIKQEDVVFEILEGRGQFNMGPTFRDPVNNSASFIALAQLYLLERLAALYPDEALSVPYKGFVFDYDIDGAIRTVTWSTGPQGGTTQIDYSIERPELRMTHTQLKTRAGQLVAARHTAAATKALRALLRKPQPRVQP